MKNRLTWFLAASSLLLLVVIIGLALHVRLGLGHWPQPMVENYDSGLYDIHEWLIVIVGYYAVYVAVPLLLLVLSFPRFRSSPQTHAGQFGLIALGWILIGLFYLVDYGKFVTWLLD